MGERRKAGERKVVLEKDGRRKVEGKRGKVTEEWETCKISRDEMSYPDSRTLSNM